MPIVDGWTLAERVKERYPEVPVVGVSGTATPPEGSSLFDAFLAKPLNLQAFLEAIRG